MVFPILSLKLTYVVQNKKAIPQFSVLKIKQKVNKRQVYTEKDN